MRTPLALTLDRTAKRNLADQIRAGIEAAIDQGALQAGARLPSWGDLAAQLGVARGTVRAAYERLADAQRIVAAGSAGTHVADRQPAPPPASAASGPDFTAAPSLFGHFSTAPALFQPGVPAQDAFPYKLWHRLMTRAARAAAASPVNYPDPRGEPGLRREIAAALAVSRGLVCAPSQVFITGGYAGALGMVLRALELENARGWMEEPGYPLTRAALTLARITPVAVRVDAEGLVVSDGVARAPDAKLAVVTPGQQAPLGMALSLPRRRALLDWAAQAGAWIIEDDYLGELQIKGRAAPALMSIDRAERVITLGTFSKTISPALRLGFAVVPPPLVSRFANVAACLAPAPGPVVQQAVTAFLQDGHYLRHLRRMKRLYAARRTTLVAGLNRGPVAAGCLTLLLDLPDGAPDIAIAAQAAAAGLAPAPLSPWYAAAERRAGLLLGVTNAGGPLLPAALSRLEALIAPFGG